MDLDEEKQQDISLSEGQSAETSALSISALGLEQFHQNEAESSADQIAKSRDAIVILSAGIDNAANDDQTKSEWKSNVLTNGTDDLVSPINAVQPRHTRMHQPTEQHTATSSPNADTVNKEYRPQKHRMCFISTHRSIPSFGFATATRPCCKPPPEKDNSFTAVHMSILQKQMRASSRLSTSSKSFEIPSKKETKIEHFSETKVFMPGSLMDVKRGCATPDGKQYYCDADKIRQRNEHGLQSHDFFRGRTTFGTSKMGFQRQSDVEGPGPAGLPIVRKPKIAGGRFNGTRNLTYIDKMISSAQGLPGPADYQTLKPAKIPGGKFNISNPKRFIDQIESAAKKLPGPADTTTNRPWGFSGKSRIPGGHTLPRGGRIMFEQIQLGYGKILSSGQYVIRDLAAEAFDATPGPGQYYNDNF